MLPKKKRQGERELVRPSPVRMHGHAAAKPRPKKKKKSKARRLFDMFDDAFDLIEDILD